MRRPRRAACRPRYRLLERLQRSCAELIAGRGFEDCSRDSFGLSSQVASQFARSDLSAARSGPTVYPKSSDLESEIEVIEALAASPRLMADNANLR